MNKLLVLVLIIVAIFITGCADDTNIQECVNVEHQYGFFGGFWHGCIAPFGFIGMLIWDDVTVYAPNNNGNWYAFGFCMGAGLVGFGTGKTSE